MNDFTTIISLVAALAILLIVLSIFLGLQIKSMKARLDKLSYKLYFELTRKGDILPLFVDKLRALSVEDGLSEIVELRHQSVSITKLNAKKREFETSLWEKFGEVWGSAKSTTAVKNNHHLLALETDLDEADSRINEVKDVYNKYVKKYNSLAGNFLLKPIALIVKSKKAEIF